MASETPTGPITSSSPGSLGTPAKGKLRSTLRKRRRALTSSQQFHHADSLQRNFLRTLLTLRFNNFALYLPADGEIDTRPLINKLFELNKSVALPVLHKPAVAGGNLQMNFASYTASTPLVRGHYNLLEPASQPWHRTFTPDVVLLPAVAVDRHGTRLGMGGGFYDRYLSRNRYQQPLRVGLLHDLQLLEEHAVLPKDPWDQPLDAVIGNGALKAFNRRAATLLGGWYTTATQSG